VPLGACAIAGEIYVTGGINNDDKNRFLSSVERYTPTSDTWSAVAPLPEARIHHAAVAMGSAMYALGGEVGYDVDSGFTTASVLKFDSVQGGWSLVAPMPEANFASAASAVGSDIYVNGGMNINCEEQAYGGRHLEHSSAHAPRCLWTQREHAERPDLHRVP
jgi:N-acetylneuraminic acid mutarotase